MIYNGVESEKHALFQNPVSALELTPLQRPLERQSQCWRPLKSRRFSPVNNGFLEELPD
jgi:hypothetical protein